MLLTFRCPECDFPYTRSSQSPWLLDGPQIVLCVCNALYLIDSQNPQNTVLVGPQWIKDRGRYWRRPQQSEAAEAILEAYADLRRGGES